jgi:hypothetical protein
MNKFVILSYLELIYIFTPTLSLSKKGQAHTLFQIIVIIIEDFNNKV